MKYIFSLLAFLLFLNNLLAQEQQILPQKAKEIKQVNTFDDLTIRKNIAAIEDRDIIIYVENGNLWLAKLTSEGWLQMLLSDKFNSDKELKVAEIELDGKGSKELLIYWNFLGKMDNINLLLKGIQIWNIDEQICYLDEYTTIFEERYMKTTDSHYYAGCERDIKFENDLLNITSFDCDMDLSLDILPETIYVGKYEFKNGKFMLSKP